MGFNNGIQRQEIPIIWRKITYDGRSDKFQVHCPISMDTFFVIPMGMPLAWTSLCVRDNQAMLGDKCEDGQEIVHKSKRGCFNFPWRSWYGKHFFLLTAFLIQQNLYCYVTQKPVFANVLTYTTKTHRKDDIEKHFTTPGISRNILVQNSQEKEQTNVAIIEQGNHTNSQEKEQRNDLTPVKEDETLEVEWNTRTFKQQTLPKFFSTNISILHSHLALWINAKACELINESIKFI